MVMEKKYGSTEGIVAYKLGRLEGQPASITSFFFFDYGSNGLP